MNTEFINRSLMKSRIKYAIDDHLYTHLRKHQAMELRKIVVANARALSSSQTGFMYRGEWYSLDPRETPPRRKDRLLPELHPQMDEYLQELREYSDNVKPYVFGFINQVLNASNSVVDYRALLPDVLHPTLDSLHLYESAARLTPETITEIQSRNQEPIQMIKTRLALNLLMQ